MGMFDTIHCYVRLPGASQVEPDYEFQTKSLRCQLETYIITSDGRLTDERGFLFEHHGVLHFYSRPPFRQGFDAHFDLGRLKHLVIADDDEERTAFDAGYKAREDGYLVTQNPYSAAGNKEEWQEGWLAHQEEAAEK